MCSSTKIGPALAQLLDDVLVVDDLLAHVHGRAVDLERAFDRLHRPVDARAVSARRRQQQLLDGVRHGSHCRGRHSYAKRCMAQQHLDRLTAGGRVLPPPGGAGARTCTSAGSPSSKVRRRAWRSSWNRSAGACTSCRATGTSSPTHTAIDSGRPVWIDDPSFNLDYHVRHTALPAPGRFEQLQDLTARIFSQQLDRSKPLWEMWLIEGLEDDRFALITKTHHSLIDGIAGVDLATVLFDLSPDPPPLTHSGRAWKPHPEPGTAQLLAAGFAGALRTGAALAEGALDALAHPERALARAREAAEGVGRDRVGGPEPGAADAAERADRPPPALRRRERRASRTSRP